MHSPMPRPHTTEELEKCAGTSRTPPNTHELRDCDVKECACGATRWRRGQLEKGGARGSPVALAQQELAAVHLAVVAGVHAHAVRKPRVELALVPAASRKP